MKRNVLVKDFFREIRGSFNRYLSILLIVALGVAFYAGVRSAEPDMKLSADALYDAQNMMDLRVLSELGLTEDDIAALSQIEGVTSAQGGYTVDALTDVNGQHTVVSIQSLGDGINLPELTQGRMPERADECLLDADYMAESGLGHRRHDHRLRRRRGRHPRHARGGYLHGRGRGALRLVPEL